ncbi:MAG: phage tail protein [Methylophilus sp.]
MHRIDGAGHLNNLFVIEDLLTQRPPTECTAEWLNAVQEELSHVIEAAQIQLDKQDNTQLILAINTLINIAVSNINVSAPVAVVPAGAVGYFVSNVAPTGWLKANGAAVSRVVYADLYNLIGTSYGVGDGSNTFNIPDLRGEFIRSLDDGAGIDLNRVLGSKQAATEISSTIYQGAYFQYTNADSLRVGVQLSRAGSAGYSTAQNFITSRPRNIALLGCIKY